jgi:hypothetical protein
MEPELEVRKVDWLSAALALPLWLVVVAYTYGFVMVAAHGSLASFGGDAGLAFIICVGFLAVLRAQARTRAAIERSRPTADELAEALKLAARKTRAPADGMPPVPGQRG